MAHKLIWSPEAYNDLNGIFTYIARDSHVIAGQAVQRILAVVDDLAVFPLSGPRIREWKRSLIAM
jgi:plasmid stabilization system protein ParE